MPLEISPVLAGTYDTPDYAAPNTVTSSGADNTDAIDSRRYTKFDHSATEAGTTTISFDDFLDMINPLQHIPVVSSIYREITGDSINPVSRVVGDILYGGVAGVASAIMGGVGAAGDAIVEAQTGKDSTGNVIASLFETDQPDSPGPAIQLAQANTKATPNTAQTVTPSTAATQTATTQTAAAQTSAQKNARAKLQAAATVAATSSAVAASMPSTRPPSFPSLGSSSGISSASQLASAMSGSGVSSDRLSGNPATDISQMNAAKGFAIDPKKLPYGGVMDPAALQGTGMAVALANSAPGLQMNHMVYTGRLMNGIKPSPVAAATSAPPTASSAYISTAAPDALPASLMDDIAALKAVNQYRSTASQTPATGTTMDVVN